MARRDDAKIRLLAVERILQRGQKVSVSQIQNELERKYGITCDRKTIFNDIMAIDRFMPVEGITGQNGGYMIVDVLKRCEDA